MYNLIKQNSKKINHFDFKLDLFIVDKVVEAKSKLSTANSYDL